MCVLFASSILNTTRGGPPAESLGSPSFYHESNDSHDQEYKMTELPGPSDSLDGSNPSAGTPIRIENSLDDANSESLSENIEDGTVHTSDLIKILFEEAEFAKQLHMTEAALMMVAHSTVSVASRVVLMDAYVAMANLVLTQLSKVITETDIAKARIKRTNTAIACNTDEDYASEEKPKSPTHDDSGNVTGDGGFGPESRDDDGNKNRRELTQPNPYGTSSPDAVD